MSKMLRPSLKSWQVKVFVLCWIAYASIYFGRVNLSVAMPEIENIFGWNKGQIGLISSLFFWIYGTGQLVNGYIGDKIQSRLFVFTGLIVTAVANILFGFAGSLTVMVVIWGINGYFQSMLWGPIAKTLSYWFPYEKRSNIAIGISTSMVGGYILAWGLSGQILAHSNWRWTFWTPGIFILIFSVIWYIRIRNHPKEVGLESPNHHVNIQEDGNKSTNSLTLWQIICRTKLWFIVIACFAQGIIKDGIAIWSPTFLKETHNLDMKSTTILIMFIPVMNFAGMMISGVLNRMFKYKEKITIAVLLACGTLMVLGLYEFGSSSVAICLLFLAMSSAMMFGANALLLGVIPMNFAKYNKVSSVAGFLDFCSYMASGCATAITGLIVDASGWTGVLVMWIIVAFIGVISIIISWKTERQEMQDNIKLNAA